MGKFKDHFSGHADKYVSARPRYPDNFFEWLSSQSVAHELAWDVGCGNGQASIGLAMHFRRVVASDPSEAQIRNAIPHPRIDYRVQAAESSDLPKESVDLLLVAQALHWIDLDVFYGCAMPALKPGAIFVACCYGASVVSPKVDSLFLRLYGDTLGRFWPPELAHIENAYSNLVLPCNDTLEPPALCLEVEWTAGQYLEYFRSWSATQRYLRATGVDPVAAIEDELCEAFGDASRIVSWPLTIKACRKP